jgi:thioredoxin 2
LDTPASLHVVCPHCQAVNRVPAARLQEAPVCGSCSKPLFAARPLELTDGSFERHIQRSEIPVLVDFWAPWCGPCRAMAPVLERAAKELEPQLRIAKLNSDDNPKTSMRYRIRSIPTLVLFRGGSEVKRSSGTMAFDALRDWVMS